MKTKITWDVYLEPSRLGVVEGFRTKKAAQEYAHCIHEKDEGVTGTIVRRVLERGDCALETEKG